MERKQLYIRMGGVIALLVICLTGFLQVLYDLQITRGAAFLEQSTRKIANTEVVEAARGEIYDRYGRVLVSNRTTYQVTLDTALMGSERNAVLTELLNICREEGVTWTDTLPISTSVPFTYTLSAAGSTNRNRLSALMTAMKWEDEPALAAMAQLAEPLPEGEQPPTVSEPLAGELLAQMAASFELDDALPPAEKRALAGVIYELTLRAKSVVLVDYLFARDVEIDFISKVKERGLPGVRIEPVTVREYHTEAAAHILGRVGQMSPTEWEYYQTLGYSMNDTVGKDGVERAFEEYLRGEKGKRNIEVSTSGKIVQESWAMDKDGEAQIPKPGKHTYLTLDIRLQEMVERALAERVPALTSKETRGAAVVVIDVKDGGVLAMASYPTFDLAHFSQIFSELESDPLEPMVNRATQGTYSPGSTFKMVTAIGALQEGIIGPKDQIRDTGRYTYYSTYQPMCWLYRTTGGTHGNVNVSQAIKESCNVFFYDVGRRLGIDRINAYSEMFGLGQPTGIELYERTGMVAGPETSKLLEQPWYDGLTLAAAIGQDNHQFTPLQLANYIATLVNGGNHWSAHLLRSVRSSDFSEVVYEREGELLNTIEIDPVNLAAVKAGMYDLTKTGSVARYFTGLGVNVGAKTGSAQISSASESNAVFVCFAPFEDPEIAIAIVVERGGSGSELGAIAADILRYYFSASETMETVQSENALVR